MSGSGSSSKAGRQKDNNCCTTTPPPPTTINCDFRLPLFLREHEWLLWHARTASVVWRTAIDSRNTRVRVTSADASTAKKRSCCFLYLLAVCVCPAGLSERSVLTRVDTLDLNVSCSRVAQESVTAAPRRQRVPVVSENKEKRKRQGSKVLIRLTTIANQHYFFVLEQQVKYLPPARPDTTQPGSSSERQQDSFMS